MNQSIKEKFDNEGYEVIKKLGKGGFGNVFLLLDMDNDYCAGKIINSDNIIGTTTYYYSPKNTDYKSKYERYKKRKEMIKKENKIMGRLYGLDYCVQSQDFLSEIPAIIMEYCEGGTLEDIITKKIPYQDRIEIIHQILLGIEQCHNNEIVHGDLKPGNMLLKYQYVPNKIHENVIKISDFGLSKYGNEKIGGGTKGYLAPEVMKGRGGSFPSDIYSVGKIMCQILSDELLNVKILEYENFDNIVREIKRCLKSDYFYDEIKKCLHPKEEYRPTAQSLREDLEDIYF